MTQQIRHIFAGSAFLAGLAIAVGCAEETGVPDEHAARAEALYGYCVQCHGPAGAGNSNFRNLDLRVPAIAGLPAWYVEAQLMKFRQGARGDHPDDVQGLRMRPMSRTLASHQEVGLVAQYVAQLQPTLGERTVEGDPHRGRELFAPCVQCHGESAQGNEMMNAPPLTTVNDWYLLDQLRKFKAGVRGSDPLDATGAQMAPMAAALPDEQAMRDVVAYISTMGDNSGEN